MTSEPLRTIRDRFSEFVDRVQRQHERITVTRNGTAERWPVPQGYDERRHLWEFGRRCEGGYHAGSSSSDRPAAAGPGAACPHIYRPR